MPLLRPLVIDFLRFLLPIPLGVGILVLGLCQAKPCQGMEYQEEFSPKKAHSLSAGDFPTKFVIHPTTLLRPLVIDILRFLLPISLGAGVLVLGLYQARLPRSIRVLSLACALIMIVVDALSLANLLPDSIHDAISFMGGATIQMALAALLLLGVAWSSPKRGFTNNFLISLKGICFLLLAIDSSSGLWWRFGAPESWNRYPNDLGWLKQSSGLSCSPTAAAMLLFQYGIPASEGEMAYLGGTTLFGSDGPAMARALQAKVQEKGWVTHTGKTNLEEVLQRKVPFLAHIRGSSYGHAITVVFISDDTVFYLDPALGEPRLLPIEEFRSIWDQTAIWIEKPKGTEENKDG